MRRTFRGGIVVCAVLLLVAAACGGDDGEETESGAGTTAAGEGDGGGSSESCDAPGVDNDAKTVTVGAWGIATGPTAYTQQTTDALMANFERVNADGGVNGWQIEYIANDTGGDAVRARQEMENLIEGDEILMAVWGPGSSQNAVVAPYIGETKVPYIPGEAADRYLGQMGDGQLYENIFPMLPSYSSLGRQLAKFAVDELDAKSIGLVYQDDDVGRPVFENFEDFVEGELGVDMVVAVSEVATDTDLTPQGQKVAEAKPDAVVFWGSPVLFPKALQATVAAGHDVPWLAAGFVGDKNIVGVDPELTDGSYFNPFVTPFFVEDDPAVQEFLAAMEEYAPDTPPTGLAQNGYSSGSIFIEALAAATEDGACPTREGLVEALESFEKKENVGMLPAVYYSGDDHRGIDSVFMTQFKDGDFELVTEEPFSLPPPK